METIVSAASAQDAKCINCRTACSLRYGFSDLCPSASPSLNYCSGTNCSTELCVQEDCNREATMARSHDFVWEAHMDMLLAPPEPTQEGRPIPPPPNKNNISFRMLPRGALYKALKSTEQSIVDHRKYPKLFRQSPPPTTKGSLPDFWIKSPSPVQLAYHRDNSRYLGFFDQDSVSVRIDDAMIAGIQWDTARGIPVYKWEYRAYCEDPETPRRIYVGDDANIKESEIRSISYADQDDEDDVPYISPAAEARDRDDTDAVGFIPAFIFGPGKPTWRPVIQYDRQGYPYWKMVKYPSIRPIACKVVIEDGYVLPAGKFGSVTKIKTCADRKRSREFAAIRVELTPYVGADRAREMAARQVAVMATC